MWLCGAMWGYVGYVGLIVAYSGLCGVLWGIYGVLWGIVAYMGLCGAYMGYVLGSSCFV